MFKLSNVINWSGFRNTNHMLPHLHSKGVTGTVMNELRHTYGVKSLAYEFLFNKAAPTIQELLAKEAGIPIEEWMSILSLRPEEDDPLRDLQQDMREEIKKTLLGTLTEEIKDEQVKNLKHYYGVLDGSGLEFFCPAEYWESDDLQIRTGGHKFWLNWCKNGGRNGSSQPFSVYMTDRDAEWVSRKELENPIQSLVNKYRYFFAEQVGTDINELPTEFLYYLRTQKSAFGTPLMQFLWPWEQHLDVIGKQAYEEMTEEGYDEYSEDYTTILNEKFRDILLRYFTSRQKWEGCLTVEYDAY